jgi:hypothetical protein
MSDEPTKPAANTTDQPSTGILERLGRTRFFILFLYVVLFVGYVVALGLTVGFRFWNRLGLLAGLFLIFGVMRGVTFFLRREKSDKVAAVAWLVAAGITAWIGYTHR